MKLLLPLFFMFFFTCVFAAEPAERLSDFVPVKGRLSNSSVSSMLQDREGYLWIGTWDGLNRFDGYEIVSFRNISNDTTSIRNNIISDLAQDENGNIWIAHAQGVSQYLKNKRRFINYNLSVSLPVRCLHFDQGNTLWMGTDNGIYSLNPTDQEIVHYPLLQNVPVRVNQINSDKNNNLLVATSNGLFLSVGGEKRFIQFLNTIYATEGASNITAFAQNGDTIYVTTYWGVYGFDLQKRTFFIVDENLLSGMFRGVKYNKETIWILAESNDLYFFEHPAEISKTSVSSLEMSAARFIFFDYTNVMWVPFTKEGLKYLPHQQPFENFRRFSFKNATHEDFSVLDFHPFKDSLYWVGTDKGLLLYDAHNAKVLDRFLPENEIRQIASDLHNQLWIGTLSNGIIKIEYGGYGDTPIIKRHYNFSEGFTTNVVFSLFSDSKSNLWAGSYESFFMKKKDEEIFEQISFRVGDTFISKVQVWDIFEDHDGQIWAGSQRKGLFKFDTEKHAFIQFANNQSGKIIDANAVKAITRNGDSLIVGTEGNGLLILHLSSGKFDAFTESDGLINNTVWSVIKAGNEGFWLGTNEGLSNYNNGKFYNYTSADGLLFDEFNVNSSIKVNDSLFLFGGTGGLVAFDPREIKPRMFNPRTAIQKVMVNDVPYFPVLNANGKYHLHLSPGVYNLLINFIAFDYSSPQKIKYKFKAENLQDDSGNIGTENRLATYFNVPPGQYSFSMQTSIDGIKWHKSDDILQLYIENYWYKTTPALLVYLLLIFIGFAGFLILRKKRNRQKRNILLHRDNEFVKKTEDIIRMHLDDSEFSVEKLASELGLSRSSLHKRLKSNTGKSAGELIRDIRLTRAYELLSQSNISVKEVSFRCGFSDSSYFTKCFKQKYGKPPTAMDK
mgnify:CR=1 FL=1